MIVKLLTEHHLEFLRLKGGYRGSSESTYVKMPHCWKSHALAHLPLPSAVVVQGYLCLYNFDPMESIIAHVSYQRMMGRYMSSNENTDIIFGQCPQLLPASVSMGRV